MTYHQDTESFSLSEAQAAIFAHEGTPTCMQGFFQAIVSQYATHEAALETFKSGNGRPWGEHDSCCFAELIGFRPGYEANLIDTWIPALEGVDEKLSRGAKVADIGCGHGSSTIMMANSILIPHSTAMTFTRLP